MEQAFEICEDNIVEKDGEHYLRYDTLSGVLSYHHGLNYLMSEAAVDVDTIPTGKYRFNGNEFELPGEEVMVNEPQ